MLPRVVAVHGEPRLQPFQGVRQVSASLRLTRATTAVGHLSGRAQLVSTVQAIHEPIPVLQHLVTGVVVDEDGDDADVRANVTAFFGDDQHQPILDRSSTWRGGKVAVRRTRQLLG